jgi:hypothetical protein
MTKQLVTMALMTAMTAGVGGACGDDSSEDESASGDGDADAGASGTDTGPGGSGTCPGSTSVADCSTVCAAVVAAACPAGPSQQQCDSDCADLNAYVGACSAWGAVVDCMGASPTFTCISEEPVPSGCEPEFQCLSQCLD